MGRWLKKLRRKKKALSEGPEEFAGEDMYSSACIGPIVIYKDSNGQVTYLFSKGHSGKTYKNHEEIAELESDTHAQLIAFNKDTSISNKADAKTIQARVWYLEKQYIIGFWNSYEQIKQFGLKECISGLSEIFSHFLNSRIEDALFNPFDDSELLNVDKTYSYQQFKDGIISKNTLTPSDIELAQKLKKDIHLMEPEQKSAYLKAMGVKPKSPTTPDSIKRRDRGTD